MDSDVKTEQMDATKMIWYDIYLMQLGVHQVAVIGKIVKKKGKWQLYTKGETMHKTTQKYRYTKLETNLQNKETNI
jgi:hypothetical protein